MNGEQWARVTALFQEACACPPAERERWLANHCGDAAIRSEVEAMLRAYDTNPEFMEQPVPEVRRDVESLLVAHELAGTSFPQVPAANTGLGADVLNARRPERVGWRIGAYDLVAELGRGGMGEVFAAVRADGHYDQKVALKLVRAGYATDGVVERFRAERQILAGLEHPNIARLVDGGTTDAGTPYLVMELVDGVPIDEFCRARSLSVTERLRLFLPVCAAVQYAHQRLVIHRDIKPANILITANGIPKLLDFGIAKVLDPAGNTEETMLRPFTPEYASPEQVRGEPVSTASDIYALGMVLYRLLTGRSPYHLESRTHGELAAAITNQEPERPSAAVIRPDGNPSAEQTPPSRLQRRLRGDLDFILLKALRKEPEKRYTSAEQLAEDIRRHLDGLPVAARKGTWNYRAGKFARRHRTVVGAATVVLITLVAGIIVTAREARIAEAHRRRAEARFNDVRKLANSLIFEVHDSIQYLPGATDARRVILQRSLEYLDSLARESEHEPDLLRELATAYSRIGAVQGNPSFMNLGDTKGALVSVQKSVEMREELARSNPHNRSDQVELAAAYLDYSGFQGRAASVSAAYEYAQRGLAILEREAQSAPNDLRIVDLSARALQILGELQVGEGLSGSVGSASAGLADLQKASRLAARTIELSPSDPFFRVQQARIEIVLGDAFLKLGDRPQALTYYRRALDLFAPMVLRGDSLVAAFDTAVLHGKMGDVALIEGNTSQAVPDYEEALRVVARLAAAEPLNASIRQQEALSLVELGHALTELGRAEDGVRYARQALTRLDANSASTSLVRSTEVLIRGWLGEALERQGKIREASHEYAVSKEVMEALRRGGANDRRVQGFFASATARLAATLVKLGEIDKATQEYEQARILLEPLVTASPGDHEIAYVLAETYTAEGAISATRAEHVRTPAAKLAEWTAASAWFRKSLDVWNTVPHPTRISTSGFEVTVPIDVSSRLARSDRAIASLAGSARTQRP
jgi:non-specific serine/threonine protein kinase/serine/threonine-protein kinase